MEFACGFVYVPQRPRAIKRSALLPPVNRIRPRSPPPPPPTNSAEARLPKSPQSRPKVIEQLENSEEVKKAVKPTPFYGNAEIHNKASTRDFPAQLTSRKTALLPPHMRPPADAYELPTELRVRPRDPNGGGAGGAGLGAQAPVPPLPPRPSFMKLIPEYLVLFPEPDSSPSTSRKSLSDTTLVASKRSGDTGPLPGNPNVLLVSLGKLLSEERAPTAQGEPASCSRCGSVLDSCNEVSECYFCRPWRQTRTAGPPPGPRDALFLLRPGEEPRCAADAPLLFCIDISGSMSIASEVSEGEDAVHKTRLQFVQDAVWQCLQSLGELRPHMRVGLVTFNHQVTMHGNDRFTLRSLSGAELTDPHFLKETAAGVPTPAPLSQTKRYLQRQVMDLSDGGTTALGPAALLTIAMASRHPGSKVIICTDGKANSELGNLEVEDSDTRTLLSSTIFYQDLGDYAADHGVTVSVLSIQGTDCRLDELGRLADRTGGEVVIASPKRLHQEFEQMIENKMVASHCTATLLLPQLLRTRGEKEAVHKGTRAVGNVGPDTEITLQFGAKEHDDEASALGAGSRVAIQLQVRYRQRKGETMLRVITACRDVTDDSSAALSSLSLAIVQLNSSQASAALAVRGRFLDARREAEQQRKLMERAIEQNDNADDHHTYQRWRESMEPIYSDGEGGTRPVTDTGAALFYSMKRSNRKTIMMKRKHTA
ncbi:circularly permutated Ras protein 1 isoform X2 [Pseudoliparis swirei]|nr:circularly permutated Ras protein 1 isoform X2 [Pseudoliparis swirei]